MEIKPSSINACWKNLWPEVVVHESQLPPITDQEEDIVNLAHQIGGEGFEDARVDEIRDLIESHRNELTEEELVEMMDETNQHSEESEGENENENLDKKFSSQNLKQILHPQQKLIEKAVELDPSLVRSLKFKREIEAASAPYVELQTIQEE